MKSLTPQTEHYIELINEYKKSGKAIAHFNISNLDQARAIVDVAQELNQPVIIGASEGEREYMGIWCEQLLMSLTKSVMFQFS